MILVCCIWRQVDIFLKKAVHPTACDVLLFATDSMGSLVTRISAAMYDIKEVRTDKRTVL